MSRATDHLHEPPEAADREPLRWHEVPLPANGDYTLDILEPAFKAEQKRRHEEKIRRINEERLAFHHRAQKDPEYRKVFIEQCRRDPKFFVNYCLWTYDDREGTVEPFIAYDFQERQMGDPYIQLRNTKAPHRITQGYGKSRAQGFTWYSLALRCHSFLFVKNWSILIGAENRDDVDNGGQEATTQSAFGKIRFMLKSMPSWMQDELLGPLFKKEQYNKRWAMQNPRLPLNVIDGKQLGGMFGRSRRYSEVWADEVAWADEMKNADVALKQTTNRFCFGSTPQGRGNFFDQAMHGSIPGVQKFWMWWAQHPMCDVDWYNLQRKDMTDEALAQELDMNFDLSVGGRVLHNVDMDWFVTLYKDEEKTQEIEFMYDPNVPVEVIIDPGYADAMSVIWTQWDELNGQGRVIDFVQIEQKSVDWIVPFIIGKIPSSTYRGEPWPHKYNEIEEAIIKRHGIWEAPQFVYGDKAGGAKTWTTGRSAWDELSKYEIWVDEIGISDDKEAIELLKLFMAHVRFSSHLKYQRNGPSSKVPTFRDVITQWRYPKRRAGSTTSNTKPVHDRFCHGGDCLKMWAQVHDLPESSEVPVESGRVKKRRGTDIDDGDYEGTFR